MVILRGALSRRPESRPQTVLEFARELQSVETQLGGVPTPLDVTIDDWARVSTADPHDETRMRSVDSSVGSASPHESGQRNGPSRQLLWAIIACAVVVVALGIVIGLIVSRSSVTQAIPTVGEIHARRDGNTAEFSWADPGLIAGDAYQIATDVGAPSLQKAPQFRVDLGSRVSACVTVTVNRNGTGGAPSAKKCVTLPSSGGGR